MNGSHDELREELAAYALGMSERGEAERLERHLEGCAECRDALREYGEIARLLPLGLPAAQPPTHARSVLLAKARASKRHPSSVWRGVKPPRFGALGVLSRLRGWSVALAATAVLALVLVATVPYWRGQSPERSTDAQAVMAALREGNARVVPLGGSAVAPGASARLLLDPDGSRAGLEASGLPELPPGRSYQFWFVRADGARTSGGVFGAGGDGRAVAVLAAPRDRTRLVRVGVTEEPEGGSIAPTGRNVLAGRL